jgi:HK97 family phage major capsid protein
MNRKDLNQLRRELAAKITEARAMLDAQETRADKKMTAEENTAYEALDAEITRRQEEIAREARMQELEAATSKPVDGPEGTHEYRSFGEYFGDVIAAAQGRKPSRLQERTTQMGNNAAAGYLVPPQFLKDIFAIEQGDAVVRPRAMHMPAPSSSPDAPVIIPALDQSGSKGVRSGVTVNWVGEVDTRPQSADPTWRQIETKPNEVSAWLGVSRKMLDNSSDIAPWLQKLLRNAIIAAEEQAFLTGDGTGKPTGMLGHASNVLINRQATNAISYTDVVNMYARGLTQNGFWIANRTVLPTLMKMKDDAGNLIWQANARTDGPVPLIGRPVLWNEFSPALGSRGDIMYVDLDYYVVRDGSPLAIMVDPYTGLNNAIVKIYAFWNVDGKPMLTTPLQQENGATTVSPFVTLDLPAA